MTYGIINLLSLIYLTGVVALVIGLGESESNQLASLRQSTTNGSVRQVLGCWVKLLGLLVGIALVISLSNESIGWLIPRTTKRKNE